MVARYKSFFSSHQIRKFLFVKTGNTLGEQISFVQCFTPPTQSSAGVVLPTLSIVALPRPGFAVSISTSTDSGNT